MPYSYTTFISAYLALISIVAIGVTLVDKRAAQRGVWRVKERTLLLIAALGGSVAMFLTMKAARHKTQHAKFMAGIPAIIVLQAALVVFLWWWL